MAASAPGFVSPFQAPGMGKGRAYDFYLAGHIAALKNVCFVSKEGERLDDGWVGSSSCLFCLLGMLSSIFLWAWERLPH